MSIKVTVAVWERSKHSGAELLVLLALADMSNDDGLCYPGKAKLAEKCRVSKRYLKEILTRLETSGELLVHRRSKDGRNNTNVYKVVPPNQNWTPAPEDLSIPTPEDLSIPTLRNNSSPRRDLSIPTPEDLSIPTVGIYSSPKSLVKQKDNREGNETAPLTPFDLLFADEGDDQ